MKHSPNVTRFGLWLRAGIISTGVVALTIIQLFDGEGAGVQTAAVGVLAALAMVWSWRRASRLLSAFDDDVPVATAIKTLPSRLAEPASTRNRDMAKNFRVPMPERP